MDEARARACLAASRVARLATVSADGSPHLVPICFALDGDRLWSAVDAKPKATTALARVGNLRRNPSVTVLADHWDEDWSQLWWVMATGKAQIAAEDEADKGKGLLREKYAQYADVALDGDVITVEIERWRWWSASALNE